jgi:hypothetical protein
MALQADNEYKVSSSDPRIPSDGDTANVGSSGGMIKWAIVAVALMVLVSGAWIGFGDQIAGIFAGDDEDVPVIRADESPVKIKPESPGGMNVPNQGRLVYGMVDGTAAQPRVERLLPAGEKPVEVEEVLKRSVTEANDVVAGTAPRGTADVTSPSAPVRLVPEGGTPTAAPSTAVTVPVEQSAPAPVAPSAPPEVKPAEVAAAPAAPQPRPEPKPTAQTSTPAPAPKKPLASAAPAPSSSSASASASAAGDLSKSYRVQLAAARSEKAVTSEWSRLQSRNKDLLGPLQLQVTRIDLGSTKGVFYRLRAGPIANEAQAKTLCQRLKQRKLGCLVVKPGA